MHGEGADGVAEAEMKDLPGRLWRYAGVIHHAAGSWPALYYPLLTLRTGRRPPQAVRPDTELVVEGFPRCGNTFAVVGLQIAQRRLVRTADHLHVPAQILRAVALGVPALVVIRDPESAVRSLVVKYPYLRPAHALKGYAGFYRRCLPFAGGFVVATFEQVTTDLGAVIDRVNARFGTHFARFEHTPEEVRRVFDALDRRNARVNGQDGEALSSYRPNDAKERAKRAVAFDGCERDLDRCLALYETYLGLAAARPGAPLRRPSGEARRRAAPRAGSAPVPRASGRT
jgi:hypothetical protein